MVAENRLFPSTNIGVMLMATAEGVHVPQQANIGNLELNCHIKQLLN